jgi:hypothetical protein
MKATLQGEITMTVPASDWLKGLEMDRAYNIHNDYFSNPSAQYPQSFDDQLTVKDALDEICDEVQKERPCTERIKEMAEFIDDRDGIPAEDVVFIVTKLAAKKDYTHQDELYIDYCAEVEILLENEV